MAQDYNIDDLYKTPKRAWYNFGFLAIIIVLVFLVMAKGKKDTSTTEEF